MASAKKFKQTKISFSKASKPKAKVPWTDDEDGSGMKSHVSGQIARGVSPRFIGVLARFLSEQY